uniref:Uncharacterized protein n=1 Tax=Leersia perrieri TaxID=77586 RepID=A0A0D9VFP7_9ORYZ
MVSRMELGSAASAGGRSWESESRIRGGTGVRALMEEGIPATTPLMVKGNLATAAMLEEGIPTTAAYPLPFFVVSNHFSHCTEQLQKQASHEQQ